MQLPFALALSAALAVTGAAQESMAPNPAHGLTTENVKVYKLEKNVIAPELIPRDYSSVLGSDCQRTESVKTELKYIVDSDGNVHDVQAPPDADANMTWLLFQYMRTAHFKPGQWNGSPVAVGLADTISFQACYIEAKDGQGKTVVKVKLHSVPDHHLTIWNRTPAQMTLFHVGPEGQEGVEHIGKGVTAPVPVLTADPPYTDDAQGRKIQGTVMLRIIVDNNGLPQNVEVIRPLGYGLDQNAVETIRQYRFKPALKDGKPVAAYMTIAINFRLY
jgi:TonB family protein